MRARRASVGCVVFVLAVAVGGCSDAASDAYQPAALPEGSTWVPDGDDIVVFSADPEDVVGLDLAADPCGESEVSQVFVRNMATGEVECVSISTTGEPGRDYSGNPVATPDGRFVAFVTTSSNLVPGDTNRGASSSRPGFDVFVRDRATEETRRVSLPPEWEEFHGMVGNPSISDNGRYVAFSAAEEDGYGFDAAYYPQVYRFDQATAESLPVALTRAGSWPDGWVESPVMSSDAQRIAFVSYATNLGWGGDGSQPHILVWDEDSGVFTDLGVPGNLSPESLAISADGRFVAFGVARPTDAQIPGCPKPGICLVGVDSGSGEWIGEGEYPQISRDDRFVFYVESQSSDTSQREVRQFDTGSGQETVLDCSLGLGESVSSLVWGSGRSNILLAPNDRYLVVEIVDYDPDDDGVLLGGAPAIGTCVYDLERGVSERVA